MIQQLKKNTAVEKAKDVAKKSKANIDNAKTNNDMFLKRQK